MQSVCEQEDRGGDVCIEGVNRSQSTGHGDRAQDMGTPQRLTPAQEQQAAREVQKARHTKTCSSCKKDLERDHFPVDEWKKAGDKERKCRDCIQKAREDTVAAEARDRDRGDICRACVNRRPSTGHGDTAAAETCAQEQRAARRTKTCDRCKKDLERDQFPSTSGKRPATWNESVATASRRLGRTR